MTEKYNLNKQSNLVEDRQQIITNHLGNNLVSFLLTNKNGMSVKILNYGAAIASIKAPDRNGKIEEVLLRHDDLLNYIGGRFYFGATLGRYANRIAGGRFSLDGKQYQLTRNRNGNMLHGGAVGFDKKFWKTGIIDHEEGTSLSLTLFSCDGEEGFPGNLEVDVIYSLTDNNELKIEYKAETDRPTVINLSNHSYFNLTGSPANSILNHQLKINASHYLPTDQSGIPNKGLLSVENTPMDFNNPTSVGARINEDYEQLKYFGGYDHNWVLNNYDGSVRKAAELYSPESGRVMEVYTDQPGLQFYSGNNLDGTVKGKDGIFYQKYTGLCLECQHFPNSPNEKTFPSTELRPGDVYKQTTIYKFSTK